MIGTFKVIYSPAAQDDIRAIYSYIAFDLKTEQAARKQVNRIRDSVRKLDTMPERHEIVDWEPWSSIGIRKFPVDNYVVFYFADSNENKVTVIRIVYSGRDIGEILQKTSVVKEQKDR